MVATFTVSSLVDSFMRAGNIYFIQASSNATDDMTAVIQAALDAVAPTGGVVELGVGTFRITTINSPSTPVVKAAGAYGIEIPEGVTLRGQGSSTLLEIHAGGAYGTGVGIAPSGFRTTADDYGAAGNIHLKDFKIQSSGQDDSSGILIGIIHSKNWNLENIWINGCVYHGIEINQSSNINIKNCRFSGEYSYSSSGSWVQIDSFNGAAGPRSLQPTTTVEENIYFYKCVFEARPSTDSSEWDLDLVHSSSQDLKNLVFEGCIFNGRDRSGSTIMGFRPTASSGVSINRFIVKDCIFNLNHFRSRAISCWMDTTLSVESVHIQNNIFYGACQYLITAGNPASRATNTKHSYRRDFRFNGNTYYFDAAQWETGLYEHSCIKVGCWSEAQVMNNTVICTGNMVATSGTAFNEIFLLFNNLSLNCSGNNISWNGTAVDYVGADIVGLLVRCNEADTASYTRSCIIENNTVSVSGTSAWTYGIRNDRGTIPALCANSFNRNVGIGLANDYNGAAISGSTLIGGVTGGVQKAVRSVTASTTVTVHDDQIRCSPAGATTITLLNAKYRKSVMVVNVTGAFTVTVGSVSLTTAGSSCIVSSDGTTNYVTQIS